MATTASAHGVTFEAGTRCLSSVDGGWKRATITSVLPDGTAVVEHEVKSMSVLPRWYGLTRSDLHLDDEGAWPELRAALGLSEEVGVEGLCTLVNAIGGSAKRDAIVAFRATHAAKSGYDLALVAGFSARETLGRVRGEVRPAPRGVVWWNQLRMGGRDPAEVARPITLEDGLAAIGVEDHAVEPPAGEFPLALRRYYACLGDDAGLAEVSSNSPVVEELSHQHLRTGLRAQGLAGDLGVPILSHHDFTWFAVFDPGDADARVYSTWAGGDGDDLHWREAAPSLGFFIWDVAQTGLGWWNETKLDGGMPVRTTDVGVALTRRTRPRR